jgi:hypothetical protein
MSLEEPPPLSLRPLDERSGPEPDRHGHDKPNEPEASEIGRGGRRTDRDSARRRARYPRRHRGTSRKRHEHGLILIRYWKNLPALRALNLIGTHGRISAPDTAFASSCGLKLTTSSLRDQEDHSRHGRRIASKSGQRQPSIAQPPEHHGTDRGTGDEDQEQNLASAKKRIRVRRRHQVSSSGVGRP